MREGGSASPGFVIPFAIVVAQRLIEPVLRGRALRDVGAQQIERQLALVPCVAELVGIFCMELALSQTNAFATTHVVETQNFGGIRERRREHQLSLVREEPGQAPA